MGFGDLLNKGKKFASSEQGKDLQEDLKDGYKAFNETEGSNTDKAKAAYGEYKENHKDDKKEDKKEEKEESKE